MTKPVEIILTQKQREFLAASYEFPVVFFGGAKGGGKSHGLRSVLLIRMLETPGLNCVLFRRTYKELEANHINRLLNDYPHLREFYNETKHVLKLPNGSTLEFRHCKHENDVHDYQGCEYDILVIDEVGQWPESMFQTLRGSNRTSKPGVTPVTLLTGNPGGIGHQWLKRIFVQRDYNDRESASDYCFIASLVYDNPALMDNDPDYVKRLEAEPNETRRRAYLLGDWDVFAGQYFTEFRRDIHVLPASFEIPKHWIRFGAYDPGFFHPSVFLWFACDEVGHVYLYRELVERGLRTDQVAERVHKFEDTKTLSYIHAGRDCWANGRDGSPSIAEQFRSQQMPQALRLNLTQANTDRKQGAAQVRAFLAWQNLPAGMPKGPRFQITANCQHSINTLPRMIHDMNDPEDVLKVDATEDDPFAGDDCYDAVRYGLMSRPRLTKVETPFVIKTYDQRVKDWQEKRRKQIAKRAAGNGRDSVLGNNW